MMAIEHIGFIIASYALAILVVLGLVAWVMLDFRAQTQRIATLEQQGAHRRSGAKLS